jgi:outer membrane receptor protein involved in Fe transport
LDYSVPNGQFTVPVFNTPYAINTDDNTTYKFTQEVRLSAPIGSHFEWLLGGYYTREYSSYELELLAADPAGNAIGRGQVSTFPSIYAEWAEFTDLTYRFSDQFDIQIGGRSSQIRQTYTETDWGPLINPSGTPFVIPKSSASANAFTYLVAPRWRVSPDSMVYARLASGYRPGGINPGSVAGIPPDFKPDRTKNYELGIKADYFDRRLAIDTSLYYIDWLGVQVSLADPVTTKIYFTNGGRAKSEGVEVSAELKPVDGLRLAGWISYDNAVLTQSMPPNSTVYGNSGDRLPYTSRFSALASADYEFRVGRFALSYGGTVSYVGDRVGTFVGASAGAAPDRQQLPGYFRIDLRSGLTVEPWSLELYANNITDRRGLIGGGIGTQIPTAFELIQPRAIGLSLSRTF